MASALQTRTRAAQCNGHTWSAYTAAGSIVANPAASSSATNSISDGGSQLVFSGSVPGSTTCCA